VPLSLTSYYEYGQGVCSNFSLCGCSGTLHVLVVACGDEESKGPALCTHCMLSEPQTHVLMEQKKDGRKPPSKRMKRISQKQEVRNMQGIGGRTSKASGAMASDKSDGRLLDRVRMEAKYTFANSFRITREVLSKIRGECQGLERPAVQLDFVDKPTGRVEDSWVIIPHDDWEKYIRATTDES